MAKKRRKKRSSQSKSFSTGGLKDIARNSALLLGGLFAGNYIANMIQKKDVSGEDLLGLDGDASKYATPAIVIAAGLAGMTMVKNNTVKAMASGVVLAGGAKLVNAVANKPVISLGETGDEDVMLPGVGEPIIPGVGDERVIYDDLPDNQEMLTRYHEDVGDVDTVYVDENGQPIEGAEDEELLGIFGDGEEELL